MRIKVTEDDLRWLTDAVDKGLQYSHMAARMGCCTDTLKRILHRHGIVEFEGAKYQSRAAIKPDQWTRPCMRCKDTKPRPKWQYFCGPCTSINERIQRESAFEEYCLVSNISDEGGNIV